MNHFLFASKPHDHLNLRSVFRPLLAIFLIVPLLFNNTMTAVAQSTGSGPR